MASPMAFLHCEDKAVAASSLRLGFSLPVLFLVALICSARVLSADAAWATPLAISLMIVLRNGGSNDAPHGALRIRAAD